MLLKSLWCVRQPIHTSPMSTQVVIIGNHCSYLCVHDFPLKLWKLFKQHLSKDFLPLFFRGHVFTASMLHTIVFESLNVIVATSANHHSSVCTRMLCSVSWVLCRWEWNEEWRNLKLVLLVFCCVLIMMPRLVHPVVWFGWIEIRSGSAQRPQNSFGLGRVPPLHIFHIGPFLTTPLTQLCHWLGHADIPSLSEDAHTAAAAADLDSALPTSHIVSPIAFETAQQEEDDFPSVYLCPFLMNEC